MDLRSSKMTDMPSESPVGFVGMRNSAFTLADNPLESFDPCLWQVLDRRAADVAVQDTSRFLQK